MATATKTDYAENAYINVMRGAGITAFTPYVALHSADPTEAGNVAELTGNGYARTAVTLGAPSNGTALNSAAVTFPTATSTWANATHYSIWDNASGGNPWHYCPLDTPRQCGTNYQLQFTVGSLSIQET